MPVYRYACPRCDREFETSQSMRDDSLTECPLPVTIDPEESAAEIMEHDPDYEPCRGPIHRVPQPVGISFKGPGFYTNDYGWRKGR